MSNKYYYYKITLKEYLAMSAPQKAVVLAGDRIEANKFFQRFNLLPKDAFVFSTPYDNTDLVGQHPRLVICTGKYWLHPLWDTAQLKCLIASPCEFVYADTCSKLPEAVIKYLELEKALRVRYTMEKPDFEVSYFPFDNLEKRWVRPHEMMAALKQWITPTIKNTVP